jgi:hypothetical protein
LPAVLNIGKSAEGPLYIDSDKTYDIPNVLSEYVSSSSFVLSRLTAGSHVGTDAHVGASRFPQISEEQSGGERIASRARGSRRVPVSESAALSSMTSDLNADDRVQAF